LVNALAGTFVGRPFHPRNLRFPDNCFLSASPSFRVISAFFRGSFCILLKKPLDVFSNPRWYHQQ
jgi:hypothetical protein